MFKKLFDENGNISIIQTIKISSIIVFIVMVISKLFSKSNSLEYLSFQDFIVTICLILIQLTIFAFISLLNFIQFLKNFVIKDISRLFVNLKFDLRTTFKTKNLEEILPININLIKLSVIRC